MNWSTKAVVKNKQYILDRVKIDKETHCWLWTKGESVRVGKTSVPVTRLSYKLFYGCIPKGHQVHRTCCNPECVNPSHLKTELHYKCTPEKVLQIRLWFNAGFRISEIGRVYKLTQEHISYIVRDMRWPRTPEAFEQFPEETMARCKVIQMRPEWSRA